MRRVCPSQIFDICIGEREVAFFVKNNPRRPGPETSPNQQVFREAGSFRNMDLTQYKSIIYNFSIDRFGRKMRTASRGPIFNICIGEREIAYFLKNSQKSPDLH